MRTQRICSQIGTSFGECQVPSRRSVYIINTNALFLFFNAKNVERKYIANGHFSGTTIQLQFF